MTTRRVGTGLGAAVSLLGIATAQWVLLVGLPVLGYGAAWPSYWLIERNNPAWFGHHSGHSGETFA
jgi:hypothetical protein